MVLSATASFAQKSGKGRYTSIPLTKGAKKDGYKIYQRGRDEINFTATGVMNPATGEKLQGKRNLEFKCGDQAFIVGVMFFGGVSSPPKKIACADPTNPLISYTDAPLYIPLTAGAAINGYEVIQGGEGGFFVKIKGAENPKTKKKLEGAFDFEYWCQSTAPNPIRVSVYHVKGSSAAPVKVECIRDDFLFVPGFQSPRNFRKGVGLQF